MWFRLVLAAVLGLLLLAGLAVAAVYAVRGPDQSSGDIQAERETAMAQSEQFMLRMGSYGPDMLDENKAMPEYRERVKEVITAKFAAEFEKEAGTAEQLVAQAGVERAVDVFATGVASIETEGESGSATTLVAGSFTDSYTLKGKTVPQEPIPFRIEVSLVRIDGEWLVDDFDPVSGTDSAQRGPVGEAPVPSEEATP